MGKNRQTKSYDYLIQPIKSVKNTITSREFLESENGLKFKQFLQENNIEIVEIKGNNIKLKDNSCYGLEVNVDSNFLYELYNSSSSNVSELIDYRNKPKIMLLQIQHLVKGDYGNKGFSINYVDDERVGGSFKWENKNPRIIIRKGNIDYVNPNSRKYLSDFNISDVLSHELGHALDYGKDGLGRISETSGFTWLSHQGYASAYAHTKDNSNTSFRKLCFENWADSVKIQQHKRKYGAKNTVVDNPISYDMEDYIPYDKATSQSEITKMMYNVADVVLSCQSDEELESIISILNKL